MPCKRPHLALVLVTANDHILADRAVYDHHDIQARGISAQEAGSSDIGITDDVAVFNGYGIRYAVVVVAIRTIVDDIAFQQTVADNALTLDIQVSDRGFAGKH